MGTVAGEVTLQFNFCLPSLSGSTLLRKGFHSVGENSFL